MLREVAGKGRFVMETAGKVREMHQEYNRLMAKVMVIKRVMEMRRGEGSEKGSEDEEEDDGLIR